MNDDIKKLIKNLKLAVFDFDGVLTDNSVYTNDRGEESVRCSRSDAAGVRRLREVGVQAFILSSETNPVVSHRAQKMQMECHQNIAEKLDVLKIEARRHGATLAETAFVGNDINDADCMKAVALPVVVADAWPEVQPLAKWVLERRGGEGAVREFCDAVWQVKRTANLRE